MSYDLYFKPRTGDVSADAFAEYFRGRSHYKVESSQALYENEDTGVYFIFDLQVQDGEPSYPVALNLNYFRPSFFGLEAQPEVRAFVDAFDMIVSDPQLHGMGEGEYSSDLFLSGWNHGNEFGYSAILNQPNNRADLVHLPTDELVQAWSWNRQRTELQNKLGEWKFVPRVMFMLLSGQVATAAVWPDGIPIAVPKVDWFIVPRKELAPRRFFRRVEDRTLLSHSDAMAFLRKYMEPTEHGVSVLNYDLPPKDVRKFVEAIAMDQREISLVAPDSVLDRELVERYAV